MKATKEPPAIPKIGRDYGLVVTPGITPLRTGPSNRPQTVGPHEEVRHVMIGDWSEVSWGIRARHDGV